jgi:hypothetical protein
MPVSFALFRRHDVRAFCAWAVLCAFLVRANIPIGYMPDFSKEASGFIPVKICHGDGLATVFLDKNLKPVDPATPHHNMSDKFSCLFSAGGFFALAAAAAPMLAALIVFSFGIFVLPVFGFARRFYFGNASSRSPPVFV